MWIEEEKRIEKVCFKRLVIPSNVSWEYLVGTS